MLSTYSPWFQNLFKTTMIKNRLTGSFREHETQEYPEICLYVHSELIFSRVAVVIQWRKDGLSTKC